MDNIEIDVNEIVNNLTEQVAIAARENAVLKAHVKALTKRLEEGEDDSSDTV
jgi:hypothetical protein